ncbi:MAG: DNA polymerase III subunit delta [Lachnospiraceae bacterium]|nr:DNA polymerase III subunit delta [Lachnospiraceae bacterium]
MSAFDRVIGHEQIIEHFQNAIRLNKISHAYILNGEEGAGKRLLAHLFSMTLQCETGGDAPCGECRSCKQAEGHNQPDIIWVTHEKPGSIGVEDVRGQVIGDMQIKPYSSPYKIYIIDEAQKLTVQAQNALLKTIEEPPAYGIVIFLTTNAESFLPTILSRCVELDLKPVSNEVIQRYLMEQVRVPDYKAKLCVAFAQGNVGKAVKLASSENFDEMKQHVMKLLKDTEKMQISELQDYLRELADYKDCIEDYLDLMLVWFRDVLLFKVTKDANVLVLKEEMAAISARAGKSSYEGLEKIISALDKAKLRLRANVNFELAMELLLLTIKEN